MKYVIIACYIVFLLLFTTFSYIFIDPGFFYLRFLFTNFFQIHRILTTLFFSLSICIFFVFYLIFLTMVHRKKISKREIFSLIVLSVGILLFSYPAMLSFDIFNYIATAKVAFFYHENPYIIRPIEFTHDPLLLFMHAANKTALYGPFWLLLTGIPFLLGFGNLLLILLNFKIMVILFYLATIGLLWKWTQNLFATSLFALNPLVIIEIGVSGHNDIVMMFLLLGSLYFLTKRRIFSSILLLALSILIKYATGILIPIYLYALLKKTLKNWEKLFLSITLGMFVIFLLSSLREEIYPWYALWFFLPSVFVNNRFIKIVSVTFTFSLLLRYIPFMLLGTYFGPTPILKILLTFVPIGVVGIGYTAYRQITIIKSKK